MADTDVSPNVMDELSHQIEDDGQSLGSDETEVGRDGSGLGSTGVDVGTVGSVSDSALDEGSGGTGRTEGSCDDGVGGSEVEAIGSIGSDPGGASPGGADTEGVGSRSRDDDAAKCSDSEGTADERDGVVGAAPGGET